MIFQGKTILITGGAGSFGQEFAEVILKEHNPAVVRIFDNNELQLVEMGRRFSDRRLRFFLGDVRDKSRLERSMADVDVVVHAAALKHIPVCEYNPIEAVRTNIEGAVNVIDAAIDQRVPLVMNIGTDKSVQPANLYGATKMVAEKLFVQGNAYGSHKNVRLSSARYGNVIASSGSVIPLFLEQRKTGEVTVTDERMTRFWISLEEGIRFVITCIERMHGGEVFVPKVPSMRVLDLAQTVAPEAKVKIVGIRPGEKLHETLICEEEARHTREFDDMYVIAPEFSFWKEENSKEGKPVPASFSYRSDRNERAITKEEMKKMLDTMKHEI
ncbi:MAG: UDP-N-acetylglucosamine 4,6-dehydratase (inverting) [Parcubacteria group bacterium]|nr:UDP-N-acetylglucosamine 4,6-dehydratase (inverting) [Parcubacteria group bacterium]